ncbi:MAG: hypothetical protein ACREQ5_33845 [Candidatus Dormibacteria bacterium]
MPEVVIDTLAPLPELGEGCEGLNARQPERDPAAAGPSWMRPWLRGVAATSTPLLPFPIPTSCYGPTSTQVNRVDRWSCGGQSGGDPGA